MERTSAPVCPAARTRQLKLTARRDADDFVRKISVSLGLRGLEILRGEPLTRIVFRRAKPGGGAFCSPRTVAFTHLDQLVDSRDLERMRRRPVRGNQREVEVVSSRLHFNLEQQPEARRVQERDRAEVRDQALHASLARKRVQQLAEGLLGSEVELARNLYEHSGALAAHVNGQRVREPLLQASESVVVDHAVPLPVMGAAAALSAVLATPAGRKQTSDFSLLA
jgi:hypothetical protein